MERTIFPVQQSLTALVAFLNYVSVVLFWIKFIPDRAHQKDIEKPYLTILPLFIFFHYSFTEVLDVSNVGLVGGLPSFTQPTLQFLDVSQNGLTGNLNETKWDDLAGLQTLVLGENKFTGTIPSSIGKIPGLRLADFTNTDLTGTMPSEICALPKVELLQADCGGSPPEVECTCCTFCTPV